MRSVSAGGIDYRIVTVDRDGQWLARAERSDTGARFGIECGGASEDAAAARLARWLEWQAEHTSALAALQDAERAYHRAIAGSAFANPIEGPTAVEIQHEALETVEAARTRLDEVRARNPEQL
jgi:hypothetical protein